MKSPRCIIIAGPNGAGKTTFAREFLPKDARVIHFINADLLGFRPCIGDGNLDVGVARVGFPLERIGAPVIGEVHRQRRSVVGDL